MNKNSGEYMSFSLITFPILNLRVASDFKHT